MDINIAVYVTKILTQVMFIALFVGMSWKEIEV